jgi:predicted kinase
VYVVLSGLPGSGKSTLAGPLAATLGWPLLAKDEIKETLWDALGPGERDWSHRLGGAAQELLWVLGARCPHAVFDTFVHHAWKQRLLDLPSVVAEVHCACPPDVARARYAARRRHDAHFDAQQLDDAFDRWVAEDAAPLALGGPLLTVDTTHPVDIAAVATWVHASFDST